MTQLTLCQPRPGSTLATPLCTLGQPQSPSSLIAWVHLATHVAPSGVQAPSRPAPVVPSEECPTWNPEPPTEGSEFCLQPLLFLCCYQKETYQQLQDVRLWPGQDVISKVNALANAIVLLPDPLSEAPEALTLDKASRFLGLLDRVLVEETTPLGPAALLATLHFLKRVTALGAGEPEPLTGPWEQLGRGVVSVASRILEKQVAGAWLSLSEVVGGPMALVASMQRLAPLLSTVLTSEQPRMSIQHHHAGLSGVTMIHSWFTSSVFQYALGVPALEPQASDSSEEADRMQRFLSTQVGSAILSSEVWDAVGEVSTAVTFHLQHQAQVLVVLLGKSPQECLLQFSTQPPNIVH
ncbi:Hypothetical predicted protein [Marmota monax]|uniref:Uncharacterized protein n=1 Tax=Marmota monax TaxID=9995 RepID=A0A5E4ADR7_MARMO|nr:Hypothetical predicted protein [Marmota monax]